MIVDEDVAFTGGVGIADEWQGDARNEHEWRDTHFRIAGPPSTGCGRPSWTTGSRPTPSSSTTASTGSPSSSSRGSADRAVRPRRLGDRLERRRHPVPIAAAARRAAHPAHDRLLRARRRTSSTASAPPPIAASRSRSSCPDPTPTSASSRSSPKPLRAPPRLRRAPVELPAVMLHAKVMTVDGHIANVGSANLNSRSMALDEEINMVVLDDDVARHARPPLRRRPRAERPDRTRALELPQPVAAGRGVSGETLPALLLMRQPAVGTERPRVGTVCSQGGSHGHGPTRPLSAVQRLGR